MARKIALVTGAGRGLGRSAALDLARDGVDVVLTYEARNDEAHRVAREVVGAGARAVALPLDMADIGGFPAFARQLREALGSVWARESFDYLVVDAGSPIGKAFDQTTEDVFDAMIAVHLKGVFFLTQAVLPLLADDGRILAVSSGLAPLAAGRDQAIGWITALGRVGVREDVGSALQGLAGTSSWAGRRFEAAGRSL